MHAQPAVVSFRDGSVGCAFFDAGQLISLEQLYPTLETLDLSAQQLQQKVPEFVERIPVIYLHTFLSLLL